mmetsp:Transcript_41407/g.88317  ORF Transcript_41407/g.88317 Transcript_41407/m.88317 type:complete len:249 (-) Transcript_41407:425-1171(-)|eukprot:CAMPEP_0183353356 /NCGR_PEP_ID=MMETSP0164_2-20130417/33206_1 /TAXON_ID=221442 /ORGANISM="Coccolithus pelagicus ssp braarudi, Strain PLY182g" /LENGTH=248 /DNA_ID=CAMNT_0025526015 /DNA_START=87 /DNA_END=833 /DNA_ORIENTATION=+
MAMMRDESHAYNAVPPPGASAAEPSADEEPVTEGPLTAAQRFAALKSKLKSARSQNHKAVVAEDRRIKIGPEALKKEQKEKAYAKAKEAGVLKSEDEKMMNTTAEDAEAANYKAEKKQKRRAEYGWDVFNNEAQYRHYKKQVNRSATAGRLAAGGESTEAARSIDADPDPLAYGEAPPVDKANVQAMVDDMHEAALRRSEWSRRRTFDEARDVTYINKRNEVYNKKIERAFDPYTTEIKANLERGTAL